MCPYFCSLGDCICWKISTNTYTRNGKVMTGFVQLRSSGQSAPQVSLGISGFEFSRDIDTDPLEPPLGFTRSSNIRCVSAETVWGEQADIGHTKEFCGKFPTKSTLLNININISFNNIVVLYSNIYIVSINVGDHDQGKVVFSTCLSSPWMFRTHRTLKS